ncbi:MAG: hypothetical protein CVV32_06465 [Methanomicrobiales archaeon HGW-Methanomicrobiales-3]|nr:MAG: hypothetical protein CVV32_06465 [Methanomicrobiales archaeon HGW-Methanomicrobiales-3]
MRSVEILTTLLDSIAMEPRALGVSSTLAPWSMNEERKLLKKGVKGERPRMLPPPLGERGGHLHKFH